MRAANAARFGYVGDESKAKVGGRSDLLVLEARARLCGVEGVRKRSRLGSESQ